VSTYVVLSRLSRDGFNHVKANPEAVRDSEAAVTAAAGKVLSHFVLLGGYDFFSVVEAADNAAAARIAAEQEGGGHLEQTVLPAIDLPLFIRLLGQTTVTTGPYPWQIRFPAQVARRALRYYSITRHVKKSCSPFTVVGRENLDGFKGPAIFIANHSSHLDSLSIIHALPERIRWRLSFGGAADRFFLKGRKGMTKQGWWHALAMNVWPIKRGSGRSALSYGEWLIDRGWSLMIFPEGTRSTTGRMSHFRHGVAILAMAKNVPVVPMYLEGLREIRPKGSKALGTGPVTVSIGKPVSFPPGTDVADATRTLYHEVDALRSAVHTRGGVSAVEQEQVEPASA
jgi:long-chain acyl-CoA synthetase